jgi:hypothetical protein
VALASFPVSALVLDQEPLGLDLGDFIKSTNKQLLKHQSSRVYVSFRVVFSGVRETGSKAAACISVPTRKRHATCAELRTEWHRRKSAL